MLLDLGETGLLSVWEEAATSIPGSGGAATLPEFFICCYLSPVSLGL